MVSGPRSARDLLCRLRFGSAPPNLRPLATFSRPGSVDHQCTPRATLADTLSGIFLTSCNLSSCQLSIPRVHSGILPSQTCYRFTCRSVKIDPDSSAHNLCKRLQTLQAPSVYLYHPSLPAQSSSLGRCNTADSWFLRFFPSEDSLRFILLFNCIRSAPCFGHRTSCSLIVCCIRTASCSDTKHLVQRSTPHARTNHQVLTIDKITR